MRMDPWVFGILLALKPTYISIHWPFENLVFDGRVINNHLNFDCLRTLLGQDLDLDRLAKTPG